MKSLSFELYLYGRKVLVSFRKIVDSYRGRHRTECDISFEVFEQDTHFRSYARLGKDDAALGRYNFFAGARIALARVIAHLYSIGAPPFAVASLRRISQVKLSLAENEANTHEALKRLNALAAERANLKDVLACVQLPTLTSEDKNSLGQYSNTFTEQHSGTALVYPDTLLGYPVVYVLDFESVKVDSDKLDQSDRARG